MWISLIESDVSGTNCEIFVRATAGKANQIQTMDTTPGLYGFGKSKSA
jgi:hypothetical protein